VAAEAALLTGRAKLASGDLGGSEVLIRRALEDAGRAELPRVAWEAHAALGEVLTENGSAEEARKHRAEAEALVRSLAHSLEEEELRKRFLAAAGRRFRAPRR